MQILGEKDNENERISKPATGIEVGSYEDFVGALISLGWNKTEAEAEERARYLMQKYPNASMEETRRHALND